MKKSRNTGKTGPQNEREWCALLTEEGLTLQAAKWFLKRVIQPEGLTPTEAREAAQDWVAELHQSAEKTLWGLAEGAIIR